MRISIAPHIPLTENLEYGHPFLECLYEMSRRVYITILVPDGWENILAGSDGIASSYELFSMMLRMNVTEIIPAKKSRFIRIDPDIITGLDKETREVAKSQLFALSLQELSKRIYAGTSHPASEFEVSSDRKTASVLHLRPTEGDSLETLIKSFEPRLDQLKHTDEERNFGDKAVSAFSAYDPRDDRYARELLHQAYEEHPGDVDDRTYLYTYDSRNKTFVQFRPMRNNAYHGMDITLDIARELTPYIVSLYHK